MRVSLTLRQGELSGYSGSAPPGGSAERLALPARHARLETTHTPLAPAQGTASQVRSSCSPTGTTSHRERPHYDAGGTVHRVLVQKRCAPANRTGTTMRLL